MSRFIVLFDACVLYPAPLRDLLMHLALTDLFHAKWTDEIHEEWIRSVLSDRQDLKRSQLERTRTLMNQHVRDCLVTGYQHLIPSIELPDANDRHVVAAAIHGHAQAIITFNLKDFPPDALAPWDLEAIHPDDFINCQIGLSTSTVCTAAKRHRATLLNPSKSVDEYLSSLERLGLPQTVSALRFYRELI